MGWHRHPWVRAGAIAAVTAAIFWLRIYVAEPWPLYLIPILMAGYWFGIWGGAWMAVAATGLYAIGRVVGPEEMGLETFPATVARLIAFGAAGVFVGWLSESRVGLERKVEQRDRTL